MTEELPSWLTAHVDELTSAIDNNLEPPDPKFPRTKEQRELRQHNLECLFERMLPLLMEGVTLRTVVEMDHNHFSRGEVRQWIRQDAARSMRYDEAKALGAEDLEDELIEIADANNSPEDVQRSTLKINARKEVMKTNNRKRYGADPIPSNPFSNGVTIVIGDVPLPRTVTDQSLTIDHKP